MIELTTDITNNLDDGQETEACVLDFSNALAKTGTLRNQLPVDSMD